MQHPNFSQPAGSNLSVWDNDLEIVYSDQFNIFSNKLIIKNIIGRTFNFLFSENPDNPGPRYEISAGTESNSVNISLSNFRNEFGAGFVEPAVVLNFENGEKLLFSIHTKSLGATTKLLIVDITFYYKHV